MKYTGSINIVDAETYREYTGKLTVGNNSTGSYPYLKFTYDGDETSHRIDEIHELIDALTQCSCTSGNNKIIWFGPKKYIHAVLREIHEGRDTVVIRYKNHILLIDTPVAKKMYEILTLTCEDV